MLDEQMSIAEKAEILVTRNESITVITSDGRPRKQSDILLDIGKKHVLFHDTHGDTYAQIFKAGHAETYLIESGAYRELLAEQFYRLTGIGCNRNSLSDAIITLCSIARFDGESHETWLRTAKGKHGHIVIDLGCPAWRAIEITHTGWQWCNTPPKFTRVKGMQALPEPCNADADFSLLWKYANVPEHQRPLVAAFIVASLWPEGSYAQLQISGEQDSGKTTLAKVIRSLIDPNASLVRAPPKDTRDLTVGAKNSWCLLLDNLSFISQELSDALCRLSTGGAVSERQLFTNGDEYLIELSRPIIFNGIEDVATRPDLVRRGLHIETEPLTNKQSEIEFWASFSKDKPKIFSAILNGLQLVVTHIDTIKTADTAMLSFAKCGAAAMPALGYTAEIFIKAYQDNQRDFLSQALDSSAIGQALLEMMRFKPSWQGTASQLLNELARHADDGTVRGQSWPKSARGLSGSIKRLAPALRTEGIELVQCRTHDGRIISLTNSSVTL